MKELYGHSSAFPVSADLIEKERNGHFNNVGAEDYRGLTVRQDFAKAAMQGLCANLQIGQETPEDVARYAVEQADALIEALNKEEL